MGENSMHYYRLLFAVSFFVPRIVMRGCGHNVGGGGGMGRPPRFERTS